MAARKTSPRITLHVATRKGLWTLGGDAARRTFTVKGPAFLGHIIHHVLRDPRGPRGRGTLLAAARTGHLGPTIFRSTDNGRSWKEAARPPAFSRPDSRSVHHTFWLAAGHASQPGTWYAGTSPHGLFRSDDDGVSWRGVDGFNRNPSRKAWCGDDKDGTPDGPTLHSILVDPRDKAHLYISLSSGGTFESLDEGASFTPMNLGVRADFLPDPDPAFGHDPHCVRLSADPDRLYQQNHTGIFRIDRPATRWTEIGGSMPKAVGSIGFPMVTHPRDPDTLWVFPMDGTDVWPRTAPAGKPAVFRSRNGGGTWTRQARGFPASQAWWTVKRQAMTRDAGDPVGLYLGTTSGEVWASADEGASFHLIARNLPHIYAVEAS